MPRNSLGVYTLPAGNPVVTNTPISSAGWGNPTMTDLGSEITNSLDRSGRGGMTAPLLGTDGIVNLPAFSFTAEPTTGMWRKSAGVLAFSVLGAELLEINALNFGLGSPPPAWSLGNSLSLGPAGGLGLSGSAANARLTANTFFNGTNWVRTTAAETANYTQTAGVHVWFSDVTGALGSTYTPTERMRMDAAGNFSVGALAPAWALAGSNVITVGPSGGGAFEGQAGGMRITGNTFFNGANWVRTLAAEATIYLQLAGAHIWYNSATGGAGSTYTPTEIGRWSSTGAFFGTALHNNPTALTGTVNQYVGSGTYTPTLTNGTNVAASTSAVCQYLRVGNVVTVSGVVAITLTASGVASRMTFSLPIPSTFAAATNGGGNLFSVSSVLSSHFGGFSGVGTTMQLDFAGGTTSSQQCAFHFTYLVL